MNETSPPARRDSRPACASHPDPDLFFPDPDDPRYQEQVASAKEVCRGCPITWDCRQKAMADKRLVGIWGGTTEDERRTIRRHHRAWHDRRCAALPVAERLVAALHNASEFHAQAALATAADWRSVAIILAEWAGAAEQPPTTGRGKDMAA